MTTAIALGSFDGVHKGHEALVRDMLGFSEAAGLESVVYIFEPHPRQLLTPGEAPGLLMTTEMKTRRLLEIGVRRVHLEKRGMEILSLSPAEFVKEILVGELQAAYVAAGFNYRFGKNAAGDGRLLQSLCEESGIRCRIIDSVESENAPISSTRLRRSLAEGNIREVNRLSFAPYTISGRVQEGKRLGREIGFPTVNIEIPGELLLPKKGVYVSRTRIGEEVYKSVTNIGQNPTVESAAPRAESHLLDFSKEVYGAAAEITLLEFLRPEQRFSDIETLGRQIRQDTDKARLYFERKDLYAADID